MSGERFGLHFFSAFAVAVLLAACGGSTSPAPTLPTPNLAPTKAPTNSPTIAPTASPTVGAAITEFSISAASQPNGITSGPDGALWFTYGRLTPAIGRLTTDGAFTAFPLPVEPVTVSLGGITAGSDGAIWFTQFNGLSSGISDNEIGRLTTGGSLTLFPLDSLTFPYGIAAGPDGALWFTDVNINVQPIDRITTAGVLGTYRAAASSTPQRVAAGPDGALWFTEYRGNRIGRLTVGGAFTEYPIPTSTNAPSPCTPDRFCAVAIAGGDITAGPDGALWFLPPGDVIGRITTGGAFTAFPLAQGVGTVGIAAGPDGALWFTESSANRIGRITTAGSLTEYPIPTVSSGASGITAGLDGAMWFTESAASKIGRVSLIAGSTAAHRR